MPKGKHTELLGKSPQTKTAKGQLIPERTSYEHNILYELATTNKTKPNETDYMYDENKKHGSEATNSSTTYTTANMITATSVNQQSTDYLDTDNVYDSEASTRRKKNVVINTANLGLAPFIRCYPYGDAAYGDTLAELPAGSCPSSSQKKSFMNLLLLHLYRNFITNLLHDICLLFTAPYMFRS
jgi:hypothetical protein